MPERRGIRAIDWYPSARHTPRENIRRCSPDNDSSRADASEVQKLPHPVKHGIAGSVFPEITLPHMHSRSGMPPPARSGMPPASLAQRELSVRRWVGANPELS